MNIKYFAWIRERIGKSEEIVEPPSEIVTVAQLMSWLSTQGDEYAYAFESTRVIRAAIDQSHVSHDANIMAAREIAFFPPMTGG